MRSALSRLKRIGERTIHPWRRKRALGRMRERGMPDEVLVVCVGNICRSPFAEGRLNVHLADRGIDGVRVRSADLLGVGVPSPKHAVAAARARGVDLREHRSVPVNGERLGRDELVLVMDPRQSRSIRRLSGVPRRQVVILGDLDPAPIELQAIPDPLHHPLEIFESCYDRLDRCVEQMVEVWADVEPRARREQRRGRRLSEHSRAAGSAPPNPARDAAAARHSPQGRG